MKLMSKGNTLVVESILICSANFNISFYDKTPFVDYVIKKLRGYYGNDYY